MCGKAHRERQRNSRSEVAEAMKRLKERKPTAFVAIEDMSSVLKSSDEEEPDGPTSKDE